MYDMVMHFTVMFCAFSLVGDSSPWYWVRKRWWRCCAPISGQHGRQLRGEEAPFWFSNWLDERSSSVQCWRYRPGIWDFVALGPMRLCVLCQSIITRICSISLSSIDSRFDTGNFLNRDWRKLDMMRSLYFCFVLYYKGEASILACMWEFSLSVVINQLESQFSNGSKGLA